MLEEVIGKKARVKSCSNPDCIGLEGKVIDESKNTITILTEKGERQIQKDGLKLEVMVGKKSILTDFQSARFRPEDRTKKMYKKLQK